MSKFLILSTLLFGTLTVNAQTSNGGIDQQMLQKIESNITSSGFKAIATAMASNSIDDLARNTKTVSYTHLTLPTKA